MFFILFFVKTSTQFSQHIHVYQFGYLSNSEKIAVISNPQIGFNSNKSFNPSNSMGIRNNANDQIVLSGAPMIWNEGATHDQSGDQGWWFDFSSLTTPGDYYIYDSSSDESSAVFSIGNNIYNDVFQAAVRMFYYNRCNDTKAAPYAEAS